MTVERGSIRDGEAIIIRLHNLPGRFDALRHQSEASGYRFLRRVADEWVVRRSLFEAALYRSRAFVHRIRLDQRALLESLAEELGERKLYDHYFPAGPAEEGFAENRPLIRLGSQSIALYTLTERVAAQFERILLEIVPDARVSVCHDLVGSNRLRQLARQADIFIISTGNATHAATDFIAANRGRLPTLRPSGKGSASMFRALVEYLSG